MSADWKAEVHTSSSLSICEKLLCFYYIFDGYATLLIACTVCMPLLFIAFEYFNWSPTFESNSIFCSKTRKFYKQWVLNRKKKQTHKINCTVSLSFYLFTSHVNKVCHVCIGIIFISISWCVCNTMAKMDLAQKKIADNEKKMCWEQKKWKLCKLNSSGVHADERNNCSLLAHCFLDGILSKPVKAHTLTFTMCVRN